MRSTPDTARPSVFDAVVVGGSFAGMSAALQLARACRTVAVIDAGQPRNRAAEVAHGCLGWDGAPPGDLLATGRRQLLAYERVHWIGDQARSAEGSEGEGFTIGCASGGVVRGKRLILAHGVTDHLPEVPGLAERWGRSVLHCPYCHGYEICGGELGFLVRQGEDAVAHATALSQWGRVTLLHRGDGADAAWAGLSDALAALGTTVERSALVGVSGHATAELADGRTLPLQALFLHPEATLSSPIARQLGCGVENAGCITTDSSKQTTVPGVFACGDAARFAGNIALAIGEGALAGVATHRSLLGLLD